MRIISRIQFVLAGAWLVTAVMACATVEVPKPESNTSAGIMIALESLCPPLQPCNAQEVYFARLNDSGDLMSGQIVKANLRTFKGGFTGNQDRYYLLNAAPATYVPVMSRYKQTPKGIGIGPLSVSVTHTYTFILSRDVAEKARIQVKPGQLAFMGLFDVNGSMSAKSGVEEGDDFQKHYAVVVQEFDAANNIKSEGFATHLFSSGMKSSKQDAATAKEFEQYSRKDLESGGWKTQVDTFVTTAVSAVAK